MINAIFCRIVLFLLWLRYRVRIRGLDEVLERGREGILFVPNHPALIEPIITTAQILRRVRTRVIADETQMRRPVIGWAARRIGVVTLPDTAKVGSRARDRIDAALELVAGGLDKGENWMLYPAGRVYHKRLEDLRGNSALGTVLSESPDARVVLVRIRGLWGSSFSWAAGEPPSVAAVLKHAVKVLLLNGIFFSPRREVEIDFYEPEDLRHYLTDSEGERAGRDKLNRFVQDFYNEDAPPNTYVPYTLWEKGGPVEMPEPDWGEPDRDTTDVPDATREMIVEHLREETGVAEITDNSMLATDLGLDSLGRAELLAWLEGEFGLAPGNADSVETVADVLLATCGESYKARPVLLKPVPPAWFTNDDPDAKLSVADGETLTDVFLRQAREHPGRAIIADQVSGVRTYRDMVTSIMALKPTIENMPGEYLGIMMPASVGACVFYFAALFAGKTPVMVNWTAGRRNIEHSLGVLGVQNVLTPRALTERLDAMGTEFGDLSDRFVFVEDVAARITKWRKLTAFALSYLSWMPLKKTRPPERAVVLFTSGSETVPKAVPLTQANILANIRDVWTHATAREKDRLIGMLPPFHSFGLTCTVLLPICSNLPTVYHPDPTDAGTLAQLIEAYGVTFAFGTPTFLGGIVRVAKSEQLSTLRIAVTGAEKCPERVYSALAGRCPGLTVIEGYGITECSPIVSANTEDDPRRFSIGTVLPALEYAVVSVEKRERVEAGDRGVLLVRGASVFEGYLNYHGPSPFVEFEGRQWYNTGDLVFERDGVLYFSGRLKRFVKLGGEMVSLPAIEAVLSSRYSSEDDEGPALAVTATADETHPEIVLFTTKKLERETVNSDIREAGLSPLHNIRRVVRRSEIPVLGTGKTDYRALGRILAADAD